MESRVQVSLSELLDWTGGRLVNGDALKERGASVRVSRFSSLTDADATSVAFFFSKEYQNELLGTAAGVLVTGEPFVMALQQAGLPLWSRAAVIACRDPYLAMAKVSEKFAHALAPGSHPTALQHGAPQVHATAVVDPTAQLAEGVVVGPQCVIEAGVTIGRGTVLKAGCTLAAGVSVGAECVFFPRVSVYEGAQIGDRVRLHAGVVIGGDGFGYAPRVKMENGKPQVDGHQKIYHLGGVIIGDDVEIGANSCVDRGTVSNTRVDRDVKIDNLVQVGHNAWIEQGAVLCGSCAIAGSAHIGKFVYIGGLTGISNKIQIGDFAKIGACSQIAKDVPAGGSSLGNPQRDYFEHFRIHAMLNKMFESQKKGATKKES